MLLVVSFITASRLAQGGFHQKHILRRLVEADVSEKSGNEKAYGPMTNKGKMFSMTSILSARGLSFHRMCSNARNGSRSYIRT